MGTSTRVFAFGEDSFALPLTSELDAIPKKRKTASRMGYRKVPTSCRGFCATPHPSHSRRLSPRANLVRFTSALSASCLTESEFFALLGCQPDEKTILNRFFLVADLNLLRKLRSRFKSKGRRLQRKEKRHPEWDTVFFGGATRI